MATPNECARTSKRPPFQFSLRSLIIAVIIAGILIGVCVMAIQGIREYKERRYESYAFRNVVESITIYVDSNRGSWPRKWTDLQGLDPQYSQALVGIDFSADPRNLAHDNRAFSKAIFLKSGRPNSGRRDLRRLKFILFQHWGSAEKRQP